MRRLPLSRRRPHRPGRGQVQAPLNGHQGAAVPPVPALSDRVPGAEGVAKEAVAGAPADRERVALRGAGGTKAPLAEASLGNDKWSGGG